MAVVLIEGWDHMSGTTTPNLGAKGWVADGIISRWIAGTGRLGGHAIQVTQSDGIRKVLPATYATCYCGFAFRKPTSLVTNQNIFRFRTAANGDIVTVRLTGATQKLEVFNAAGSSVAVCPTALLDNVWYYIEVRCTVAGASGTVEIRLGGVTELASTVGNFGTTNIGLVYFALGATGWGIDDTYVNDTTGSAPVNTWLGDSRVETLRPSTDGAYSAWTPNSGSTHYSRLNEDQVDSDTTYITATTAGMKDSHGMVDLTLPTGTIYGVQSNIVARMDTAGSRQICSTIRHSGADTDGPTKTLTSSYVDHTDLWARPGGGDWTVSDINAVELGVKVVT